MKNKISKKIFIILSTIFLGISIVLRCKPTLFYGKTIIENIAVIILTLLSTLVYISNKKEKKMMIFELLLILTMVFYFQTGTINKYLIFTIIGIIYYFVIQEYPEIFRYIKYPIIIFAIITSIVSWIAFIKPNFYISHILTIFSEHSALTYSFLNRNMNHGFTNHYSRNAFYISIGIMVVFSNMISNKKVKKRNIFLLLFFMCTMFLVAKRGTTIFLLATMFLTAISKESNFKKKIGTSCKFMIIGLLLLTITYFTVPGVSNLFNRLIEMSNSDDVSTGRFYLYNIAWSMFLEKPIFGNGWGSFLNKMNETTFQAVHNDYIQLLAETGVIGTFIFLTFNIMTLKYTYNAYRLISSEKVNSNKNINFVITFSLIYQTFFMLYSLTGYPHFSYEQNLLYLMSSGVGIGIYKYYKKNKGELYNEDNKRNN